MTKRVQLAGGSAELEQVLVGLERELRVDLDNDALRLHDGVKEGGYLFLNRDATDQRYQARSLELDGFNFSAQGKGILVRVGPAAYKLRKVTSLSGDITLTNIRGTAGDFDFRLSDEITTDHLWSGVHTFSEAIAADGGLDGETRGLHVGNVVGNVTGNLTGDANGNHTGTFTGDVDVRGFTILFDDGQIPESALDPNILVSRGVPLGAILMWSGLVAEIPDSWHLCDGTTGTPDLRSRFIIGAGGAIAPGTTGGSSGTSLSGTLAAGGAHSHTGGADAHAITIDEMPAHSHLSGVGDGGGTMFNTPVAMFGGVPANGILKDSDPGTLTSTTSSAGGGQTHTHAITIDVGGDHSHDLTLDDVDIMPPYYALCYIMKIV